MHVHIYSLVIHYAHAYVCALIALRHIVCKYASGSVKGVAVPVTKH